jgi:hypothetical protein
MFKNLLLTLAEPGSEGGGGGGGEPDSIPSGLPPLPSVSARERIYEHADAAPNSGTEGETAPAAAPDSTPKPPEPPPDSAKGKEPIPAPPKADASDPVAEKRVKDAQAALTVKSQEAAVERKAREAAEAKLAKVGKYVDLDKLEAHDKEEAEKDKDRPVTVRDLEALKANPAPTPPPEERPSTLDGETREKFLTDYYGRNAHVRPYAESGEAYGVFLKEAERLGPEIAALPELEQLQRIGEAVATHFRTKDATREKEIAERLNTSRTRIGLGTTPASGGAPGTGEADDPGDDPGAEIARRNALRSRVFRPTL